MRLARSLVLVGAAAFMASAFACGIDLQGTLDVGAEGGVDGSTAADGGADGASPPASDAADGSMPSFCDRHTDPTVFACWDFESPERSIGSFGTVTSDGTIGVVTAGGSQAMSVALPEGQSSRAAWVTKALGVMGASGTKFSIAFRFAIPATTLDYAAIGGFRDANGSIFGVASYSVDPNLDLSVTAPKVTTLRTSSGPTWHTALVELEKGVARPSAKVTIDGMVVMTGVWDVGAFPILDLRLGAYYTAGNDGAYQVLFDDVLVRRE